MSEIEFANKKDLDGLGGRVNNVEAFNERQKEVNVNHRREIDKHGEDIISLYGLIRNQDKNIYKMIGGTSAIVIFANFIIVLVVAWLTRG